MIRVELAPEPDVVDRTVRQPGLRAIAELVGEPSSPRPGPRRVPIAQRREDIPPSAFPAFWTEAIDDLLTSYRRLCAYTSLYIYPATGAPTVDHLWPKSQRWDQVYEWSNYRLACSLVNAYKGAAFEVLDPFEIDDDWFGLELVGYQVISRDGLDPEVRRRVEETIDRLGLNSDRCCRERAEYGEGYLSGDLTLTYLDSHAPFIARELRRQGKLRPGDT